MWSKKVSINTTVSKEQIWKLWSDVKNWKSWDEQVIESELNGAFELGRSGFLIPKGGPKTIFELIEVTKNKSFTSRSTLPLTKMDFIHTLNEENGRLTKILMYFFLLLYV